VQCVRGLPVGRNASTGVRAHHERPSTAPNPLVAYLRGAELQCEDDAQRINVRRALDDLATLPLDELRVRRYADYQGTPGAWDLPRVLRAWLTAVSRDARDRVERSATVEVEATW
jgi:hypothetical protein